MQGRSASVDASSAEGSKFGSILFADMRNSLGCFCDSVVHDTLSNVLPSGFMNLRKSVFSSPQVLESGWCCGTLPGLKAGNDIFL